MGFDIYEWLLDTIGLIIAAGALYFHTVSIRRQAETSRLNLFQELQNNFFSDTEATNAYYMIEHEEFVFGTYSQVRKNEKGIDKLMFKLNNICKLYKSGEIKDQEFKFFEFYFVRVISNKNAIEYLNFLSNSASSLGLVDPYGYLNAVRSRYKVVDLPASIDNYRNAA